MTLHVEFQAVVLAAGKASRMQEIAGIKPKCLLPVGTKPLVWYSLYKLQKAGFTDVILVVLETQRSEIQAALEKTELEINIEYFTIPANEDLGTADSLRLLHDKLHSNVLVLSCDLVSDVNLRDVLNTFRKHNASVTSLLFKPQNHEIGTVPGPKSKHKPERDIIGIDGQTHRLVFQASASDFESEIALPKSLIKKHTNIKMYSNLLDSHVYVLKNWIIKYLKIETHISTIKGELLPHIIKKQLLKPPKQTDANVSLVKPSNSEDIFAFAKEDNLNLLIRDVSSFNDHSGDLKPAYHGDSIRCFAYIAEPEVFGIRINTLPAYCTVNKNIIKKWDKITNGMELVRINPKAEIKSTQVDDQCIVWDNVKLHEKTSFKMSILGSNTEVLSRSRVFNSIVMNNVVIKEGVALENCIVCDGAVIETGSHIKNCLIGYQHVVPEKSEHSNELLTESDQLMEF